MQVTSDSFAHGERIPEAHAAGKHDPESHATFSDNRNPHLAWDDLPAGTRSVAIVCHDTEAPTRPDDVNQPDRTVPYDLPRAEFVHWVLVDVDPEIGEIAEGSHADGFVAGGKDATHAPHGRAGVNDYTGWFAGDPDNAGTYFGYDGPFPPFNDEREHVYHFTVYALDLDSVPVAGDFTAADVHKAIEGHILDQARLTATYAIYPDARPID